MAPTLTDLRALETLAAEDRLTRYALDALKTAVDEGGGYGSAEIAAALDLLWTHDGSVTEDEACWLLDEILEATR